MSGARGPRLAGRNVLVTGSTGLAASAATAIAAEGGAVFAVSRTAAHLEALAADVRAAGGRCEWHAADLRAEDDVEAAFAAFDAAFGRLDAVYSVAGISARRFGDGPIHEATLEGWETVITANATSQFLVARAAVRRMLAQAPDAGGSRGSILLMSSTLATRPVPAHFATHGYAASKAAIEGLTRAMAATYARGRHPRQRDRAVGRRDADEPPGAGRRGRPRLPRGQAAPGGRPARGGRRDRDRPGVAGRRRAHGHGPGDRRRRRLGRRRGSAPIGNSTALPRRTVAPYRPSVLTVRLTIVAACLAAAFWLPATATAADPVVVAGVVTAAGGVPAAGVEVVVVVAGTDLVRATTTDAAGAFSVEVEAAVGDTIDIRATGPTVSGEPDEAGCVTSRTPIGGAGVTIESLPLDPVAVELDQAIESQVCSATATPDRPSSTHRSNPTPPATDRASDGDGATPAGRPFLAVAGLAFVLAGIAMVVAWRSRSAGR